MNTTRKLVQFNCIQMSTEHFLSSVQEGIGNHIEHPRNEKCICGIENRWNKAESISNKSFSENNRNSRKTARFFPNDLIKSSNLLNIVCCVQKTKVDMNFSIYTIFWSKLQYVFKKPKLYVSTMYCYIFGTVVVQY